MDIQEIIRLAFLKYRLSGRRSMNTFIFTQAKNNKLTDKQVDNIIDTLESKIAEYHEKQKEEWKEVNFTCNIDNKRKRLA